MKPVLAWAIVENDKLAVFDYRLPIMWLRRLARLDAEREFKVIRVEIREVPRPNKPKRKRKQQGGRHELRQ